MPLVSSKMRHGPPRSSPPIHCTLRPLQIINLSAFASKLLGYSRLTPTHAGCTLDDEQCANAKKSFKLVLKGCQMRLRPSDERVTERDDNGVEALPGTGNSGQRIHWGWGRSLQPTTLFPFRWDRYHGGYEAGQLERGWMTRCPRKWPRTVIIIDGMSTTSTCGYDLDEKTDTLDRKFIEVGDDLSNLPRFFPFRWNDSMAVAWAYQKVSWLKKVMFGLFRSVVLRLWR